MDRKTACPTLLLALSAGAAAFGCGESVTGLGAEFDASTTASLLERVSTAGDENVALAHFPIAGQALLQLGEAEAAVARRTGLAGALSAVRHLGGVPAAGELRRGLQASISASAAGAGQAPLIAESLLGKTLVLEQMGGYAVDESRTDAPSNAVRFLLYELDPVTRRPRRIPLKPLGDLDLFEGSGPGLSRLSVQATNRKAGTPFADFSVEGSFATTQELLESRFSSAGLLRDGRREIQFAIRDEILLTDGLQRLDVSFQRQLAAPAEDLSVSLEVEGQLGGGGPDSDRLDLALSVAQGPHQTALEVTLTSQGAQGTLSHNGQTVLLVSGDEAKPTFSRADGTPLRESELRDLQRLWDETGNLLGFGDEILTLLTTLMIL